MRVFVISRIIQVGIDCSQSPIFPCDRRCGSWSLNASETGQSTKFPWVEVVEGTPPHFTLLTPPPLPKGILFSPQFRSHQETEMAAQSN